jgi:hypothetical protein
MLSCAQEVLAQHLIDRIATVVRLRVRVERQAHTLAVPPGSPVNPYSRDQEWCAARVKE